MQIPAEILEKWKTLRSESDTEKIGDLCVEKKHPQSKETIRAVFRTGKSSDELFEIMGSYYEAKMEMVSVYMPPVKQD
jgi:hypothetical protein